MTLSWSSNHLRSWLVVYIVPSCCEQEYQIDRRLCISIVTTDAQHPFTRILAETPSAHPRTAAEVAASIPITRSDVTGFTASS